MSSYAGLPILADAVVPRDVVWIAGPPRPRYLVNRDKGDEDDGAAKGLELELRLYEEARSSVLPLLEQIDPTGTVAASYFPPPFLARAVLRDLALS